MPVRLGILGAARIAVPAVIEAAKYTPEIEVAAIASRSHDVARSFSQRHGVLFSYSDYRDLLADETIDAVYIPLPNSHHASWAHKALQAGKAVLCEKPLASNAAEALRMANAAQDRGLLLVEAFHYRYHPLALFIGAAVASGELGDIKRIDARFTIPGKLIDPDDIRFRLELGGGAMMDLGSYCMNALRFVAGEVPIIIEAEPELVRDGVDGAMRVHLRFPSGAKGTIYCSLCADEMRSSLDVEGACGGMKARNIFLPHLGNAVAISIGDENSTYAFPRTTSYVFQLRAFAQAVKGRREAVLTGAMDSVANMAAIDAVYRAAGLAPRFDNAPYRD